MRQDKSCWLQSPRNLLLQASLSLGMGTGLVIQSKHTDKLAVVFYLIKHKTKNHFKLADVQCTVHTYVNADMYATFESFKNKGTKHQKKWTI